MATLYEAVTEADEVVGNPGLCRKCGKHYDAITCEEATHLIQKGAMENETRTPSSRLDVDTPPAPRHS